MTGLADSNPDYRPFIADRDFTLHLGDVREILPRLDAGSVDCVVTSPPYWGLRDYNAAGQIGLEATPELYVAELVAVFREVRRVLAPHGTCWVNLADSYNNRAKTRESSHQPALNGFADAAWVDRAAVGGVRMSITDGQIKEKDLVGIPWRVAFALQADGWYLRSDIVWSKPNPMPESVTDRPTKSHEYVFLLTKQPRYFFDQEAVREPAEWARWGDQTVGPGSNPNGWIKPKKKNELTGDRRKEGFNARWDASEANGTAPTGRNVRSVWEIPTQPYPEAHFATFPEALPERCIKAGCPEQVCQSCGKPRERIVEREGNPAGIMGQGNGRHLHDFNASATGKHLDVPPSITRGWSDCGCMQEGCEQAGNCSQPHPAQEQARSGHPSNYRPGVVLDPFMGSGTVALVARRLGCRSIGVELSPEYAVLAARRLQQLSLLAEASV